MPRKQYPTHRSTKALRVSVPLRTFLQILPDHSQVDDDQLPEAKELARGTAHVHLLSHIEIPVCPRECSLLVISQSLPHNPNVYISLGGILVWFLQ